MQKPLLIIQILIISLLACSAPLLSCAKPKHWHHVEMIVFSRDSIEQPAAGRTLENAGKQQKPIELLLSNFSNPMDPIAFSTLPEEALLLNREINKLLLSNKYQIIMHTGWLQPITSGKHARPIHFVGGENFAAEAMNAKPNSSEDGEWQIDGLLWLRKLRGYYSVRLNVALKQPLGDTIDIDDDNGEIPQMFKSLQLSQQQRAHNKELLYFDHPGFGILLKLSPYDEAQYNRAVSKMQQRLHVTAFV